MANICLRICSSLSWIRIPFTFGQIEEETQDTNVGQTGNSIEEEENEQTRRTRTQEMIGQPTKYNGLVSSLQLLIILVVLMAVATLTNDLSKHGDKETLRCVEMAFMVIGLAIMISIYKFQERFLKRERKSTGKSERDSLVLIGIVTFCALGCLYNFFGILNSLACCSFWILCQNKKVARKQLATVIYHIFKIIYLAGQTVFCMLFNKSSFANSSLARHALMYLQAVNMIFWFSSFIEETVHIFRNHSNSEVLHHRLLKFNSCFLNETVRFSRLEECTLRNQSIVTVVHQYANPILRPFIIEYALLVGESLAHWFLSCGKKLHCKDKRDDDDSTTVLSTRSRYSVNDSTEKDLRNEHQDDSTLAEEDSPLLDSTQTPRRLNYRPMTLVFCVGLAVLSNLLLCVFAFLPKILNDAGDASLNHTLYKAYYHYHCLHLVFLIVSVLLGYGVSNRFKVKEHATFSGLDYMLLFASSGPVAICSFKLLATGARNLSPADMDSIKAYKTCLILEIMQVPLQVVFMLYAGRVVVEKTADNIVQRASFRAIVVFLALSNACLWCIYTFSEGYLGKQTLDSYYGIKSNVIMKVVIGPVSLFFRFNSCLIFARVFFQTRSKVVK